MSEQEVPLQLRYLRRYARALSGCQQRGDALVLTTLEILARQNPVAGTIDRVGLYIAFSNLWNSEVGDHITRQRAGETPATKTDARLLAMTSLSRQAFLLVSVEGFSLEDASRILDTTIVRLEELLALARREVSSTACTDVLIIEDEFFIAAEIEEIVRGLGHRIIDVATTRARALELIRKEKPGLVLSDICLADGSSGVDAVNEIIADYQIPIIFITAYPERLLTGLRPEPTFLIEKPFSPEAVAGVIAQALFFDLNAELSTAAIGQASVRPIRAEELRV